jgi:hypothetical protein
MAADKWTPILQLLKSYKRFKGRFLVMDGYIRHRRLRVGGDSPYKTERLCPLNALCRAMSPHRFADLQNNEFERMGIALGFRTSDMLAFADASDHVGNLAPRSSSMGRLRRRIIRAIS